MTQPNEVRRRNYRLAKLTPELLTFKLRRKNDTFTVLC